MRYDFQDLNREKYVEKLTLDDLYTLEAYARSRDLSPSTVTRQVGSGLIPVHGDKRLIDPEEADAIRAQHLHPGLRKGSLAKTLERCTSATGRFVPASAPSVSSSKKSV